MYKDVIVHTACIVEAVLHHILELHAKNEEEKLYEKSWTFIDPHPIHRIGEMEEIVWCRRKKKRLEIRRYMDFKKMNELSLDLGILNRPLFEKCEMMRKLRNNIHLSGLTHIDAQYKERDLDETFAIAKAVMELAETRAGNTPR